MYRCHGESSSVDLDLFRYRDDGLVFVLITFIAFALFELLKRLAIHPIQYSLAGIALVLFFLLLISLSEHLSFGLAYSIAASSCIALLGFYLIYVLRSIWRSLGFVALLAALYGALYILLLSEDYALLLGSLLLFILLAVIMVVVRRVDWYRIEKLPNRDQGEEQDLAIDAGLKL